MTILTGTRFGQYEIAAPLGKGGMGEVYLARDTRLERQVALKILPLDFTQSYDRLRRFEQEAKTVSALNHPNIITIHEIGAQNGTHFITTEYIAGQTLRDRLQQPLTQSEAIDIALQIANALAAAHEAGIIHRDIKPENVMIRNDGLVKVLDFGLAKLTETRNAERGARKEEAETLLQDAPDIPRSAFRDPTSTMPGTVMGTASYMSPEQSRGLRVDARTDIFSLGVVLYEMLAGKRPFEGVNMIDVLGAILHEAPAPLADVPDELQRIVTKALQKDRHDRYASVKALQQDLQTLKEDLTFAAKLAQTRTSNETEPRQEQAFRVPASAGLYATPPQTPAEAGTLNAWRPRLRFSLIALTGLLLLAAAYFLLNRKATPALAEREPLLLADFENKTGEEIWDGTLKQALAVALEQSPYMNIYPEERARDTLRLMNQSVDEPITRATGREICQRRNVRALLIGTIAKLERSYTVTLEATNAQSGETMARALESAEGKDKVLEALGRAATDLRGRLGESLVSLQKSDKPLAEVTTSSLDALKAYSLGAETRIRGKWLEAIPFLKRAVEIDPNFAYAYAGLAAMYTNSNQAGLASEAASKAFALKERVSDYEKLRITLDYYDLVTGEQNKSIELLELQKHIYPRDSRLLNIQASDYRYLGQFEKAAAAAFSAIQLNSDEISPYINLGYAHLGLGQFAKAKEVFERAGQQPFDSTDYHDGLYRIAFAENDIAAMQQHITWARGNRDEYVALDWQTGAAAFAGQWRKAQEFSRRAIDLATRGDSKGVAAQYAAEQALRTAVIGQPTQVLPLTAESLRLERNQASLPYSALALVLADSTQQTTTILEEIKKQYPKDTFIINDWLPTIRAAQGLQRGNAQQAIEMLQDDFQYEAGAKFWPTWIRAQAYLRLKQGAQAAAEFQKIIDHRGWDVTSPLWPLAHLGLARAAVMQSDTTKAKQYYDEFFRLWKDADPDLPVLIEAKKEYARLP